MHTNITHILENIKNVNIAVYGDFCLDVYWLMDPAGSEISVETGRQAEAVQHQYCSPGGAGNVVANVAALGPKNLWAIGVIGPDLYGRELMNQLQNLGVETSGLISQEENFSTYAFHKKYVGDQEEARFDFGIHNQRAQPTDKEILSHLRRAINRADVLIFNQQIPGSINRPAFIKQVNELFSSHPDTVVLLDSRHYTSQFRHVYLKLNEIEVAKLRGVEINYQDFIPLDEVQQYGLEVFQQLQKPLFITCGDRGIMAIDAQGVYQVPGIQLGSKIDAVGAGDTALSALALCLGAGSTSLEAVTLANYAAAVSVQKLRTTGTASPGEILELSQNAYYIHQPELAQNPKQATYWGDTEIEICLSEVSSRTGQIKHAVFDHDGTISILREGWEQVMEPFMIKSILGPHSEKADMNLYKAVQKCCADYINASTGIQTILQMEKLVEMVDEFNVVPKDQILDQFAYKQIFNEALLDQVNRRAVKFKKGELQVEDLTIKGVLTFLRNLMAMGVKLYLASGTDREDVIKEAELLGYASLFDGGIHGSVGDISKYSKKMVIDQIIKDHQLAGNELLVLGDGPVEIRECKRFGGIAVGIACDEPRRYGLDVKKRKRLIRAGADLVIPDFSQGDKLIEFLFD